MAKATAKGAQGPDEVVRAALALAARLGWRHVTLADIAAESKTGLAELYDRYRSKDAILAAFTRAINAQVLAGTEPPAEEESVKDRLFDALMRRFDALKPYREGLAAVLNARAGGPVSMACMGARMANAMAWTLESVGVSADGVPGGLKAKGLLAVYATTLRVWLRDDTEDMARTMAELDKRLGRAERLANTVFRTRRPPPVGEPPPRPDAPPA